MNFDLFCKSLLYMAYIAYRDVDSRVTAPNKVKAILLYMWKAVNDNDKAMRLVNSNRSNTLSFLTPSSIILTGRQELLEHLW
jgi:hypothetical protein